MVRRRGYFKKQGYEITHQGGDAIIKAPAAGSAGLRQQVRIGHTSCGSKGTEMLKCYPSAIKRAFGVDLYDVLKK